MSVFLPGCVLSLTIPYMVKKFCTYKESKSSRSAENVMAGNSSRFAFWTVYMLQVAAVFFLIERELALPVLIILYLATLCTGVDHYIRIIPNEAVLSLLLMAAVLRFTAQGAAGLLSGAKALAAVTLIFGGSAAILYYLKGIPGVGAGDLKFAMAAGFAVGMENLSYFLAGAAAAMVLYCILGALRKRLHMDSYFPMCAHLSAGLACALFLPEVIRLLGL